MAVATTTAIALGAAAISAGAGAAKTISANKRMRAAKRAAENFRYQPLENVNEGRRISTRGADLMMENSDRAMATAMEALRSGGVRGVVGGSQSLVERSNEAARRAGANLDQQQVALDRDIAMDEAKIREIQENRDINELNAIQGQMNAAAQDRQTGMQEIAGAGYSAATAMAGDPNLGKSISGSGDWGSTFRTSAQNAQKQMDIWGGIDPMFT